MFIFHDLALLDLTAISSICFIIVFINQMKILVIAKSAEICILEAQLVSKFKCQAVS